MPRRADLAISSSADFSERTLQLGQIKRSGIFPMKDCLAIESQTFGFFQLWPPIPKFPLKRPIEAYRTLRCVQNLVHLSRWKFKVYFQHFQSSSSVYLWMQLRILNQVALRPGIIFRRVSVFLPASTLSTRARGPSVANKANKQKLAKHVEATDASVPPLKSKPIRISKAKKDAPIANFELLSSDHIKGNQIAEQTSNSRSGSFKGHRIKKSSPSNSVSWHGLSKRRLKLMRVNEYDAKKQVELAVTTLMTSALECPQDKLRFCLAIASSLRTLPPPKLHAALIRTTVDSALRNLPAVACASDVAVEAFLRLSMGTPPSVDAITTVSSFIKTDPSPERRAEKGFSLLRYILAAKVEITQSVLRPLFDIFVSSLHITATTHMLRFALAVCTDFPLVDRAHWFDCLAYVALIRQTHDVTSFALEEKAKLGLPETPFGRNVALSLDAEQDKWNEAEGIANSLLSHGEIIEPFASAALIHAASRRKDILAARHHFAVFEDNLRARSLNLSEALSLPAKYGVTSKDYSGVTAKTLLVDPTVAMFDALRACGEAEESIALMFRLRRQYSVRFSKLVSEIVSQTCFRSKRLDLAIQLRKELEDDRETQLTLDVDSGS